MIRIIRKSTLDDLKNEIDKLNTELDLETSKKNRIINFKTQELDRAIEDKNKMVDLKNNEIKKLERKINDNQNTYIKEISEKNKLIEELTKEKEECMIRIHTLNGSAGGYKKEINRLKNALEAAESKNKIQVEKIQELTKNKNHSIEEYKNNGLRKNMKKKRG